MMRRTDREGPIQRAIIERMRVEMPDCVVTHVPNALDMAGPNAARQIAKQVKNGMLPGFPDLVVVWRGVVAFVEVKAPGGTLQANQRDVLTALERNGAMTSVMTDQDAVPALAKAMAKELELRGGFS